MSDLKKKYYDGFQIHKILNEELDSGKIIMRILSRFADEPSAQPEIIRCKDCIKRDYCRTTNIWAVPPGDDWYCADAERRGEG